MHTLFQKYPNEFDESIAINVIHNKIKCALDQYEDNKESTEHLKYMAIAMDMLAIYFQEKGVNPAALLH